MGIPSRTRQRFAEDREEITGYGRGDQFQRAVEAQRRDESKRTGGVLDYLQHLLPHATSRLLMQDRLGLQAEDGRADLASDVIEPAHRVL